MWRRSFCLPPAVAEIQGATEVTHRKILRLLARARLPEDSSTHTTSREERLYAFYAPESKEDAKAFLGAVHSRLAALA